MTGPRKLGGRLVTIGLLGGTMLLTACSADTGKILGLEKTTPDEFAVVSRAPLSLPPEYGLRPPDPNGQRFQDLKPQLDAQRAVFGEEAVQRRLETEAQLRRAGVTPGEMTLLDRTGAIEASPEIRLVVDEETAALAAEQESFVDDLVFWREAEKSGDVIDANEETRRIQGNSALGVPVTEGQTPIITREGEKSWFEWPF
ncbi:MAG: DUF3035 domain-containing protein [Alphaproteobacteria bacterium]|nr:DUF3035 domain-containing protein [Alphaproteobacteria bacterium]